MAWLLLALCLALLGLAALYWSRRQRLEAGLPTGQVVYADTGAWQRNERTLFSARHRLAGRPDYIVEERGQMLPVEVKPRRLAEQPYAGDVLQLAAYCLLVEEEYGRRPRCGYLKYQQAVFRIDYTGALRRQLLERLAVMQRDAGAPDVAPSHSEPLRCQRCGH
ncbi:MAG: Dna2/Cas4 domain-containing protein, partial [Chloroflexi bacterium]|nr:Dna2/Cas4 domain-containing protein [Chloroflexota bacterium]